MPIKKCLYLVACLCAALLLSSCFESEKKEPLATTLLEHLGKTLTYEVWGCKTVLTKPPIGDQWAPIADCGDFAAENGRLPREGEPGFANTQKVGQVRVKIEGDEKGINDVLFGVDDEFAADKSYNAALKTIVEDLNNRGKLDAKNMHSLKQTLSEPAHSKSLFTLSPAGGSFPVSEAKFETANEGGVAHAILKLKLPAPSPNWFNDPDSFQQLRFSFEASGQSILFRMSTQMKAVDPNNIKNDPTLEQVVKAGLPFVRTAGASEKVALLGISISFAKEVLEKHDASLFKNYAALGGPEFRFMSSN